MKSYVVKHLPMLMWIVFLLLAFQLLSSWVFVRFLHYEAQYRSLEPETYQVRIITPEDYILLQDRSQEAVTLSDGTTYSDRQPSFYQHVLPSYKKSGDQYVRVTTLGTSHYYYRWITDMLPLMIFTIFGLVLSTIGYFRRGADSFEKEKSRL